MMLNKFDIDVFINNLELLRKITHLSKADFGSMLGIRNPYRRDCKSLGDKMLSALVANFRGVDKNWILAKNDSLPPDIAFTPRKAEFNVYRPPVANSPVPCGGLVGGVPDYEAGDRTSIAIEKVKKVMNSGCKDIAAALWMNIVEFERAVDAQSRLNGMEHHLSLQAIEMQNIRAALAKLEKPIDKCGPNVSKKEAM